MNPNNTQLLKEQKECLVLSKAGRNRTEIAEVTGLSLDAVKRRLSSARKRERLDPKIADRLEAVGVVDLAGLHSGWVKEKRTDWNKDTGKGEKSGESLYFYLGEDQEKIDFVEAMVEVLSNIPKLEPIKMAIELGTEAQDCANWIALADLHVGGHYGDPILEEEFRKAVDHLVLRLPPATHAVVFELGDLLDANDHLGVTPANKNPMEVKRENYLANTLTAVSLIRYLAYRLLETHKTAEIHMIKGNHDPSAYVAVMLALAEHFKEEPRMRVVLTDDEYRVVSWGACAAFPHHGDTLSWDQLKDVFADQFPDEWAAAKAHRHIITAHFHTDRKRDLMGAVAEHFQTIHRPNKWAKGKGLFARGSLTAITVHKERGEEHRTKSNIRNLLKGL